MSDSKLISRLKIVVKENGNQRGFAQATGISQPTISRVLNGTHFIPAELLLTICHKLGYNPSWVINGTGDKKKGQDDNRKLITQIAELETQIKASMELNRKLQARMETYEDEVADLRILIERLQKDLQH